MPLAVAVTAAAGAFSVLFSWYNQPLFAAALRRSRFRSTRVFDLRGVAFAAWTLAAFAIGVLAGDAHPPGRPRDRRHPGRLRRARLRGRAVAARALHDAAGHHSNPNLPGSAWIISQWYTKGGRPVSQSALSQHPPGRPPSSARDRAGYSQTTSTVQYLTQHGYTQWTSYQPGSRFWPFQWIEGGWLLALSVLLIAATVWLVRRRAA